MSRVWPDLKARLGVSRETEALLGAYIDHLLRWQKAHNLLGHSTLDDIWDRHIADSAQLLLHERSPRWLDVGTGAGLPGVVLAILEKQRPDFSMDLLDSNTKKAAFLRIVVSALGLPARVLPIRLDDHLRREAICYDVVTSRACAPLDKLVRACEIQFRRGATGLFLKGKEVGRELTDLNPPWNTRVTLLPSLTDPAGGIVRVAPEYPIDGKPGADDV